MTTPVGPPDSPQSIEQVLASLEAEYQTKLKTVPWTTLFRSRNYSALYEQIEQTVDSFLQSSTEQNVKDPEKIIERIRKRRGMLPLTSDINSEVVGICKQVLAFGAAGLGLSLGFADKLSSLPTPVQRAIAIGGIVYLEIVLVSLVVLIWYLSQARFRYPFLFFKHIGNSWPWFYYASIDDETPRSPFQLPYQRLLAGYLYARDLVRFTPKVLAETQSDELRVELQQYFLLLSFQGYVNQFLLDSRTYSSTDSVAH